MKGRMERRRKDEREGGRKEEEKKKKSLTRGCLDKTQKKTKLKEIGEEASIVLLGAALENTYCRGSPLCPWLPQGLGEYPVSRLAKVAGMMAWHRLLLSKALAAAEYPNGSIRNSRCIWESIN